MERNLKRAFKRSKDGNRNYDVEMKCVDIFKKKITESKQGEGSSNQGKKERLNYGNI